MMAALAARAFMKVLPVTRQQVSRQEAAAHEVSAVLGLSVSRP